VRDIFQSLILVDVVGVVGTLSVSFLVFSKKVLFRIEPVSVCFLLTIAYQLLRSKVLS
jgi:hypothetical protein